MKKLLVFLGLTVFLWSALGAVATGQDEPALESAAVVGELAEIRRSLDALVTLFSRIGRNQETEIVLRRIEMHERRLAPLERSLKSNQEEQFQLSTSLREMEEYVDQSERKLRDFERSGADDRLIAGSRTEIEMLGSEILRQTSRLEAIRMRGVDLENDLAAGRDDVDDLDDLLETFLE